MGFFIGVVCGFILCLWMNEWKRAEDRRAEQLRKFREDMKKWD